MMKKGMKMLSLLIVIAMVLTGFMAGCGSDKNSAGDTTAAGTSAAGISTPAQDSQEGDAAPKLEGKFEIVQFSNGEGSDYHNFWLFCIEEFKKLHPDVEVVQNIGPNVDEGIRVRMASDSPPDYILSNTTAAVNYAKEGKLTDLTEWFNTAKAIGYEGLIKDNLLSTEANVTLDGKIYAVPSSYYTWGIYYNKNMAKENGWTVPTNWKEFLELAPKIKEKGIFPMISTGVYADYFFAGLLEPGAIAQGGRPQYVDIQNLKEGAWQNSAVLEMYKRLELIVNNEYVPKNALALNHTESQIEFLNGKAFMLPCGNWLEGEMAQDIPEGFEFGFVPGFMQDEGKKPVYVSDPNKLTIPAKAQNIEAAKEFFRIFYSKAAASRLIEIGIAVPYIKDDFASVKMMPTTAEMMQQLSSGTAEMVSPKGEGWGLPGDVFKLRNDMVQAIWGGKATPEEAVKKLDEASAKALADSAIPKIKAE